jgi:ankyrin repeat protein
MSGKKFKFGHDRLVTQSEVDDYLGDTPLLKAAETNNFKIVKLLVEQGADINKINQYGISAVMMAAKNGSYEMFKLMNYFLKSYDGYIYAINSKTGREVYKVGNHVHLKMATSWAVADSKKIFYGINDDYLIAANIKPEKKSGNIKRIAL